MRCSSGVVMMRADEFDLVCTVAERAVVALTVCLSALAVLSGCSATLDDARCPVVANKGWEAAFCQDSEPGTYAVFTDEAWREVERLDLILEELGMETVAEHLPGTRYELHDMPAGSTITGYYMGWHDADQWRFHLFVSPDRPRPIPSRTALLHELWHGYERNVMGVDAIEMQTAPGHFVHDETARAILGAAASDDGCATFDAYWQE